MLRKSKGMIKKKFRIVISYVGCGAKDENWGRTHQELKDVENTILLSFRESVSYSFYYCTL